jgi:hypothetical protein
MKEYKSVNLIEKIKMRKKIERMNFIKNLIFDITILSVFILPFILS